MIRRKTMSTAAPPAVNAQAPEFVATEVDFDAVGPRLLRARPIFEVQTAELSLGIADAVDASQQRFRNIVNDFGQSETFWKFDRRRRLLADIERTVDEAEAGAAAVAIELSQAAVSDESSADVWELRRRLDNHKAEAARLRGWAAAEEQMAADAEIAARSELWAALDGALADLHAEGRATEARLRAELAAVSAPILAALEANRRASAFSREAIRAKFGRLPDPAAD
jgi:hypothetical protein